MNHRKNPRKTGNRFENKCQKSINSGALWFSPLDLNYKNYSIEAKYTDKKSYSIKLDLIEKIWEKSLEMNKDPLLIIGMKRNDTQIFTLRCEINLERK
jgi:hypothetical protein